MSDFIMSPGVSIKEIDNSQYSTSSDATGNVVALVGYTEKGSFEPTYCYSQDDYVKTFGKTLADVPYLSQAAYKYFDDGKVLLVSRAGDNRDPEIYPNAAKYSSKKIRVNPTSLEAKSGYQTFKRTAALLAGSFTPNANYSFSVLADNRAFKSPKYMETWVATVDETYNGLGTPSPAGTILNGVVKFAADSETSSSLIINHKRDVGTGATQEFYGTGNRMGISFGSEVTATIHKYYENGNYVDVPTDYINIKGIYGAAAVGSKNIFTGYDWSNTAQDFVITLGSNNYRISLSKNCADADEVVDTIEKALLVATNTDTNAETDISAYLGVMKLHPEATVAYVALTHKSGTDTGFSLVQGNADALATALGIAPAEYRDTNYVYGRWDAEAPVNGASVAFSGNIILRKTLTTSGAVSFQDAVEVSITSPAQGPWSINSIANAIQTKLESAFPIFVHKEARAVAIVDSITKKIKISAAGGGVTSEFASIVRINAGTNNDFVSLIGGTDAAVSGAAAGYIGESVLTLRAKEKGSYGQKIALKTETQIVKSGAISQTYFNAYVLYDGKVVSSYYKINWGAGNTKTLAGVTLTAAEEQASDNYILTKMASDGYIVLEAMDEDDNITLAQLPDGIWTLGDNTLPVGVASNAAEIIGYTVGTNGWVETNGAISSMSADFENALNKISNPEVYGFHIVAAPGDASSTMHNAIQDFCNSRRDCIGVVDAAPYGIGIGIADNTRSITEVNEACSTLNSSYVAAFWPWVLDYDSDNGQYVWLPPSIYAIKAMVYTDAVSDCWYAPAGLTRGVVSASDVEYSATSTERDILQGDTAIVNPIVKFVNEGIAIWGQKTAQRTLTATNRINVRRLMIYAEKLIAKMARTFLFEPDDEANWTAFARQANGILEPIRQRRGLYSFEVVCDSSTNTDALVNQNLMAGKIYLQPTKTIEGIFVDFTINAAGATTITESK